ncbi:MAG: hypothetical protein AAFX65_10525 [Cyanobacteria bacterium J06638_7]
MQLELDYPAGGPGHARDSDTSAMVPTAGRLRRQIHLLIASTASERKRIRAALIQAADRAAEEL